jgi:hypothetical protein
VDSFIVANRARFEDECPFAEPEAEESHPLSVDRFEIQVYDCPGVRKELLAITPVPGFFAVFALSSQNENSIQSSLRAFEKIISSFRWFNTGETGEILPPADGKGETPHPD